MKKIMAIAITVAVVLLSVCICLLSFVVSPENGLITVWKKISEANGELRDLKFKHDKLQKQINLLEEDITAYKYQLDCLTREVDGLHNSLRQLLMRKDDLSGK